MSKLELKIGMKFHPMIRLNGDEIIIKIIALDDNSILWEGLETPTRPLRRWIEPRPQCDRNLENGWELIVDKPAFDGKGATCPYCNTRDSNIYNSGFSVECVNPACFCYKKSA